MPELTLPIQKLISRFQVLYRAFWQEKPEGPVIHVDEVARRTASFYERIHKIVDWKEEHLMRRTAIGRILKRRLFLKRGGQKVESFILELIRGSHFPNDKIEKAKISRVQKVIDKYTFILKNAPSPPGNKTKAELYIQLLSIAACEVEETLSPISYKRADALIELMETFMRERIKLGKRALAIKGMNGQVKKSLIYIAIQQALLRLDEPIINYNLLKRRFDWQELSGVSLEEVAKNIYAILREHDSYFSHPLADKFYKLCERYDTPYLLLGDVIGQDPMAAEEKISRPEKLEGLIREAYSKRLKSLRKRTSRAAFYSTLSIFLSNVFALYVLEIPFAKYVMGQLNQLAMFIDIFVPTFLMFLLVVTIRLPGKRDLQLVLEETQKIVYGEGKDIYEIELYPRRGCLVETILSFLYTLDACVCLGTTAWFLWWLKFPPFSWLLFYIFVSLIAFAGVRIRERARELHVSQPKISFLHFILDPFALPVVHLGRWLSLRWKKFNIISVILVFLIDTPFMVFVEFLEQWRYFLREKQEEIH